MEQMNEQQMFDFLISVGGKPIAPGLKYFAADAGDKVEIWNFGLLQEDGPEGLVHTQETTKVKEALLSAMPRFQLSGRLTTDPKKVILTDVFKEPLVNAQLNKYLSKIGQSKAYPGNHQLTGSCVGTGNGNNITIAASIEVAWKGDAEMPILFWWPYTYGRGRFLGGMRTPGEGSMSESQAEANLEGNLCADESGLPQYQDKGDGLVLNNQMEMQWSDGDSQTVMAYLDKGKIHKFKTSAVIRSVDDARACIRDAKMPFMWCGSWGGLMQCPVVGNPPCLLNRGSGSWSHNETCIAWWDHPELGELFGIWNQWGNAHGMDPAGLPMGAYWIKAAEMQRQISGGSCISVTGFDGFPALDMTFDWTA